MEVRIDPSVAGKARLAWDAAWRGKRESLGDEAAAALGHDLKWAACWRTVADSTLPPRTRSRIEQIETMARKLESLLASNPDVCRMIEQFCLDFTALSPLEDTRRGLAALCQAAGMAKTHRGGAANLRKAFGSAERVFICTVASAYSKFTGRKATVSRSPNQRVLTGPFVRFVQEASRQFCEGIPPSPETIKKALAGRNVGTVR